MGDAPSGKSAGRYLLYEQPKFYTPNLQKLFDRATLHIVRNEGTFKMCAFVAKSIDDERREINGKTIQQLLQEMEEGT